MKVSNLDLEPRLVIVPKYCFKMSQKLNFYEGDTHGSPESRFRPPHNNFSACDDSQHKDKRKQLETSDKKLTWDELVYVRIFSADVKELKTTYPKKYPYKHGRSVEGKHQQQYLTQISQLL